MFFSILADGYATFRTDIHQRCITGVIHGVMMPFACLGVGMLFRAIGGPTFAELMAILIFASWEAFYLLAASLNDATVNTALIDLVACTAHYAFVSIGLVLLPLPDNSTNIKWGLGLIVVAIIMMEVVGHWLLEGHASNLRVVFNSIFHTIR